MIKMNDISKETIYILDYFDSNFVSRIPNKFLENLKKIAEASQITVNIDKSKKLEEQEISEDCKDLISLIYYTYVANEDDKKEIIDCWNKNEAKYQNELNEKYNVNTIFKNINNVKKSTRINDNNLKETEHLNLLQTVEKHSFIKSIWKKIKGLFNINSNI